ncbi:probable pectinesterase 53 [Solanum stenotomum]|uniref:probable pectinesterase 53 n=1 Tax=Solanum stenotomum TaxID=172797 RepID=UPI0020D0AE5B|nr:probable pectinesterase 53 [Solanum stenotomum]
MASASTLIVLLFFLSMLLIMPLTSQEKDNENFDEWISLNVKHYNSRKRETSLKWMQESIKHKKQHVPPAPVSSSLDPKLIYAEMNKMIISVSQDGSGNFNTIKEALASLPLYNKRRVILDIKPGVYREKINIPRSLPFVTFRGDSTNPPRITGNDTASATGTGGTPLKTFQSATVSVDADYFIAINVIFENTAPHVVGTAGEQAVALRISGNKAAFYNCSFYGSQDTLYDHKGLHYFNNCFIQGSVDFIFGYGRSLYENCQLNSVAKKVASLTAQKRTNSSILSGFSFKNSTITGTGSVYLGRAWGDYSRVIFSYTYMDNIVLPLGWNDWGKTIRDSRVYYGEYRCSGPGANMTGRVPWARILNDEEAMPFIETYYVDGNSWLIHPY